MVRKWSYINNSFLNISPKLPHLKTRFNFKIFRKNTRFKNINQGDTLYIRKLVILRHRRMGWKPYFVTSSMWVNFFKKSRKLITFLQTQLLHKYTTSYPYLNMFFKKSNLPLSIGVGRHSINYTFLKNINTQHLFSSSKTMLKHKVLLPTIQFSNLSKISKLTNLGFKFTNLTFIKHQFPLIPSVLSPSSLSYLWKIALSQAIVIRQIHTYLILKFITL